MVDNKSQKCHECDSEFFVFDAYNDKDPEEVSFCPQCGSELYELLEDDEDYLDDYEEE